MAVDTRKYDEIFARAADKYGFSRKMVGIFKAIVQVESYWNSRAYRYEPELFKRLKAKDPFWADKDPSVVSASYGLAQILFTTAWTIDRPSIWKTMTHQQFQRYAERLYDPEVNIFYQAQLLRLLVDRVWQESIPSRFEHLSAVNVSLARYNGGSYKNPDDEGVLDEQKYVDKVWRADADIRTKEAK